jgi:hypothetical protein
MHSPPLRRVAAQSAVAALVLAAACSPARPAGAGAQTPTPAPGPTRPSSASPAASSTTAAGARASRAAGALSTPNADPFPSTYRPFASRPTVIRNVTVMTAAGPTIRNGAILLRDGKVAAVGTSVEAPADAVVIDGAGKYVTPGIVDTHSHIGAGGAPGGAARRRTTSTRPPPRSRRTCGSSTRCGPRTRSSRALSPGA